MYQSTSSATMRQFGDYAAQRGFMPWLGRVSGFAAPQRGGRYHSVQNLPPFRGNIASIDDRFDYGMQLADTFSTLPPSGHVARPAAGERYLDGSQFRAVDRKVDLHGLDAELDDINVDEDRVIALVQGLSDEEQR